MLLSFCAGVHAQQIDSGRSNSAAGGNGCWSVLRHYTVHGQLSAECLQRPVLEVAAGCLSRGVANRGRYLPSAQQVLVLHVLRVQRECYRRTYVQSRTQQRDSRAQT